MMFQSFLQISKPPFRLIAIASTLLGFGVQARADSLPACVTASLQDYIDLSGGCQVGDEIASGWGYSLLHSDGGPLIPSNGLIGPLAAGITVTPLTDPLMPGFTFEGQWNSMEDSATALLTFGISFTMQPVAGGNVVEGADLSLLDWNIPLFDYGDFLSLGAGVPGINWALYPGPGPIYAYITPLPFTLIENTSCFACVSTTDVQIAGGLGAAELREFSYSLVESKRPTNPSSRVWRQVA